jgi:hypothetical protein
VVALPIISALLAFACVGLITRDALRRPTPDRLTWIVAFALFGIAAASEAVGEIAGWNAPLARVYYLTGAVLVVGFLALGQMYLLAGERIRRVAPGVALLLTAISASTVWGAPIDRARLTDDGWDAIERTSGLTLLAVGINSIGTLILVGGLIYSVVRFRRAGTNRNRMIGCLLIAGGTLAVAMGGTLTRLGSDQYLYIAMSIGITLIFGGYVEAGRQGVRRADEPSDYSMTSMPAARIWARAADGLGARPADGSPGIAFIEFRLQEFSDSELAEECRIWSVPTREIEAFSRTEARRVWSFRNRLSSSGQTAFDARPVGLRLQLAELYFEVLAIEIAPIAPIDRLATRNANPENPARAVARSVD